jgi:hypothetical protein
MAKGMQDTSSVDPRRFDKELNEDVSDFHLPPDSWTKARNAINNSVTGDLGKLGNEPSNSFCIKAPYPIIGFIHINADRWAVFSTNNTDSEIGLFEEGLCKYDRIVNDACLKFNQTGLIKGVSRRTADDCSYQLYWDDGINPSRTLDINAVPYKQSCTDETGTPVEDYIAPLEPQGCITCVDLPELDCDKIRLAALVNPPCITVRKGVSGGTLANGMYFATIAYTIDGQKITDYSTLSNQQPIFQHDNAASSIEIIIDSIDTRYDEFELVVVSVVAQQTVARKVGIYSTRQRVIILDAIQFTWPSVPIEFLPVRTTVTNKTDAMYNVNNYLLRVGTTSKFDFNYQPLANQIITKWTSVEYPQNYYQDGGSNSGYMRDEVYAFFIRWIYDTGDKSALYHIPGRPAMNTPYGLPGPKENSLYGGVGSLSGDNQVFETFNTATSNPSVPVPYTLDDGGVVIDEGYMGYWESTEKYPDDKPEVWNASPNANGDYDLCGERIRHHKFPDNTLNGIGTSTAHFTGASPNFNGNPAIRVLGVKFENIRPPVDNQGNTITTIVGYEILRGSRSGNRTVLAKGMINNMGLYDVDPSITNRKAAYPNYPYNDLRPDPFLSTGETYYQLCFLGLLGGEHIRGGGAFNDPGDLYQQFSQTLFTFHSPETAYDRPFLSGKELKICGELRGTAIGKFEYSENHPKFKMISNTAFIISALAGIGLASLAMNGERTIERTLPRRVGFVDSGDVGPVPAGLSGWANPITIGLMGAAIPAQPLVNSAQTLFFQSTSLLNTLTNVAGISENNPLYQTGPMAPAIALLQAVLTPAGLLPGMEGAGYSYSKNSTAFTEGNDVMNMFMGIPIFSQYWATGTDTTIELIYALLKFRDYALKYNSHCFYNNFIGPPAISQFRRDISEQQYLDDQITDFGTGYRINNLYRSKTVALSTSVPIVNPVGDNTRQRVSDRPELYEPPLYTKVKDPTKSSFATQSAAYYVAYKQRLRNQYGQVDGIRPVPVSTCWGKRKNINASSVLFNGDVYISRYTEKNTFFYFYDWLDGQLDGFEFDYLSRKMMPYPRYWMNSQRYDVSDFTTGLIANLGNLFQPTAWEAVLPSNFFNLDGYDCDLGSIVGKFNFGIKYAYFYLFNSGVRDFFVESELNVGLRDWGFQDTQKHYPIVDIKQLFHSSIIKSGNYFAYDQSLSITRNFVNNTPWGEVQTRDYSPLLAETCYTYSPNNLIYSLPAVDEAKRDAWLFFLANNYKTFISPINCIKPVNKNGALILFNEQSPIQFYGTDQLQTDAGTKLTIGDGGLFQQPLQNLTNADASYEYASCQDRLSVINTPAGVFWISQNQGKIFNYQGQLNEISRNDLKWWFASYLPYKLTEQFPDFELKDNPVIGIGCQSIYDNENSLVYFTKRDFIVRTDLPAGTTVTYMNEDNFLVNGVLPIKLGNTTYFEDASWTISYDPKTGAWVSWHDWHPNLMLPGKNTFMTVLNSNAPGLENGIWVHNERCDSYCNYYGNNYPFEIEYMVHTVQQVNTVRSIEYLMEVYKYGNNCFDRFHSLDFNFDEAVIYNTEQCSGLLKLNLNPKNDPTAILLYPQIGLQDINILYSKEEQKFRFNQFWDITADRGEFNPNAERVIWNTGANGYVRSLNPNNLNYSKNPLERKKFRHYVTFVLLRRNISGDKKMLVMISQNKNLQSLR